MIDRTPASLAQILLAACAILSTGSSVASEVTTQRIVTMPEHSTASPDFPATIGPNGEGSGTSSVTINGKTRNVAPLIGSDGLPVSPDDLDAASSSYSAPAIHYDLDWLPQAVARTHHTIHSALLTGQLEALRMAMEMNEMPPVFDLGGDGSDPIEQVKNLAAESNGVEILAILAEILEAGFVHVDAGTPQEMYVWPYFAYHPLHQLTLPQKVELFRLITAGEFAEMQALGRYVFFRIGIGPDGTWHYLLAGE